MAGVFVLSTLLAVVTGFECCAHVGLEIHSCVEEFGAIPSSINPLEPTLVQAELHLFFMAKIDM